MKARVRFSVGALIAALAASPLSCSTLVGSALRDAAIDGAASFVEAATTDALDRLFPLDEQE